MKAYITLFSTNEYIYGLIGLMYSWKRTNPKYPFYVIVTPDITEYNRNLVRTLGYKIIERDDYVPKAYKEDLEKADENTFIGQSSKDWSKSGWHHCWTKFEIFGLTEFKKLVYMDADTFVLQNLDDLFDKPHMSAPHETCSWFEQRTTLNAGMLVVEPNKELYEKLLAFADTARMDDNRLIADQDVLNKFFPDWYKSPELALPYRYHANWYMFSKGPKNRHRDYVYEQLFDTKAIHMVGKKPWLQGKKYYGGEWEYLDFFYNFYIDYLNRCLDDLYARGISVLPRIEIRDEND